jgi:ASC-1-like (ASCH) protein
MVPFISLASTLTPGDIIIFEHLKLEVSDKKKYYIFVFLVLGYLTLDDIF